MQTTAITEHLPSVHIQLLLVSAAHSWLFHIDAGSAHVPGGWQLSAPLISPPHPAFLHLTSPFLSSFLSLPTVWLLLGAWLSRLAPFTETAPKRRLWHEEMWACVCAYVTSLTWATVNHYSKALCSRSQPMPEDCLSSSHRVTDNNYFQNNSK